MSDSLDTYNKLWQKCEQAQVDCDDYNAIQSVLTKKEFNYLLITMFFAVSNNGGIAHAHNSFGLDDDEERDVIFSSLKDIGCIASIEAHTHIANYVAEKGVDTVELLDEDDYLELDEAVSASYWKTSEKLNINEDRLLEVYGQQIG